MQAIRGMLVLFCSLCCFAVTNCLQAQTSPGPAEIDALDTDRDTSLAENRLRSRAAAVIEAVVRVEYSSEHATSGVIVSEEGHVLWPGSPYKQSDLSVVLASGETVAVTSLGWSREWDIGLLKLTGDRKWPHVEFGSTKQAAAGDECFEVGYHASEDGDGFARLPDVRLGELKHISPCHWFWNGRKITSLIC